MKNKSIIIMVVLLLSVLFYWFQIRPAVIKHDCSWVKMHTDVITAKDGMTEEQLKEKGLIKICPSPTPRTNGIIKSLTEIESDPNSPEGCVSRNQDTINTNKPQKYAPAKDWYDPATTQQYTFCLHDKGL